MTCARPCFIMRAGRGMCAGLTMAGVARMDNIEDLWGRVLAANTPGDFVETGALQTPASGGRAHTLLQACALWKRCVRTWRAHRISAVPTANVSFLPS
jgi:Macrocin-O-methyltransferase (TylF)